MTAICGNCKGRHNNREEYLACSLASHPPRPYLKQLKEREEARHREALKRKREAPKVKVKKRFVPSAQFEGVVTKSRGGHQLSGYESAGVNKRTRELSPWTGSCTCGDWTKILGSRSSLEAAWEAHVSEALSSRG